MSRFYQKNCINMRKDKAKSLSKVAISRLKDPLKTTREVEKETWVDHTTVSRRDKELQQTATKDDRILWICDTDIENVTLWQDELQRRLKDEAKDMRTWDIVQVMAEGTKRYTIFKGDITDNEGWMKQVLSQEQLDQLLERLKIDEEN